MARIGLVAGWGSLPVIFAKAAKAKGDTVIAFGLKGATQEDLSKYVERMHWLEWGDFQKGLLLLVTERINKIIMLGKIEKKAFFKDAAKLDEKAKRLLDATKDKKDYSILNEVKNVLAKIGIEVIDSTTYLKEYIPSKGTLTQREPTGDEWDDINYALGVAKELARLDTGQTVAVKDKTVIALEAIEGTDNVILRAGGLSNGGFVVVKTARPNQDMRFDVPLVGLDTLKALLKADGKVLALEADKTLLMDREEVIKLADQNDISVIVV